LRLRTLPADLLVLLGVLCHPSRHWKAWRGLAHLLGAGGATIDTPPAAEDDPISARTVIQPDGDVIVIVDPQALLDDQLVEEHLRRVADWYGRGRGAVHDGLAALRALIAAVSGTLGMSSGWYAFRREGGLSGGLLGVVVFAVLPLFVGWLLGRIISSVVQRKMKGWLGGGGLAG